MAEVAWNRVRRHCEEKIELARKRIEVPFKAELETEHQRGRLAALREVLRLSEEKDN